MEIYLAYAILFALWLLGVTPLIGCIFMEDYLDFKTGFETGIKVQIVIIALCAVIGVVMWAFDTVFKNLQ